MEYKPSKEKEIILNQAMAILENTEYTPSLRWLFYQLVQNHKLKKTQWNNFKQWMSFARKRFYKDWYPGILADSVRETIIRGFPTEPVEAQPDYIINQENYVEIWFEARAMVNQFWKITQDYHVTLMPFAGDISIPMKWETAKRLEETYNDYEKPIIILYFGDLDKKGQQIPQSAIKDIRKWCNVDIKFIYCGLTKEQANKYNLPDNPERPGQYQWEALSDKAAREIIMSNLNEYWSKP